MKELLRKVGLAALTFTILLALLELGLRIAGYGNLILYAPDPDLYWKPVPNQRAVEKIGRTPLFINSHGTRGAEFSGDKPPRTFRVLCLGDSRAFGWGLGEDDTYEAQLRDMLAAEVGPGGRVEVINAGVNSWSYPQMLVYLKKYGLSYSPDAVVLDGANRWTTFGENQSPEFRRAFRRRVILKNLLRRSAVYHYVVEVRLQKYYERYRRKLIPEEDRHDEQDIEARETELLRDVRTAMKAISNLVRANGADLVLLHIPREDEETNRGSRHLKSIMREVASGPGCALVDVTEAFAASGRPLFQEADPVHFNTDGSAIIAEHLFGTVRSTTPFESFRRASANRSAP